MAKIFTNSQKMHLGSFVIIAFVLLMCIAPYTKAQQEKELSNGDDLTRPDGMISSQIDLNQQSPKTLSNEEDTRKPYRSSEHHRKKLRSKNRNHHKNEMRKQPEAMTNMKYVESDKKYFDYFPIEDTPPEVATANEDIKVVYLSEEAAKRKKQKKSLQTHKKHNNSRSKRDVSETMEVSKKQKRDLFHLLNFGHQSVNPWNNPMTRQAPAPYYLPVPRPIEREPVYIIVHSAIRHTVPGIYHNPETPSHSYLPPNPSWQQTPSNIPNNGQEPTFIGSKSDFDDPYIFDRPNSIDSNFISSQGKTVTTQAPPLVRPGTKRPQGDRTTQPPRTEPELTRPPRPQYDRTTQAPSLVRPQIRPQTTESPRPINRPEYPKAIERNPDAIIYRGPLAPSRPQAPSQFEPTKCVSAIVHCCKRGNLTVRYSCFEQFGCHGSFFDVKPCADDIQDAAVGEVGRYYD